MTLFKPAGFLAYVPSHAPFFLILALLWMIVSFLNGKIGRGHIINMRTLFYYVVTSNLIATSCSPDLFAVVTWLFRTVISEPLATFLELVAPIWLHTGRHPSDTDLIRPSSAQWLRVHIQTAQHHA
jgi:hypothetical protein